MPQSSISTSSTVTIPGREDLDTFLATRLREFDQRGVLTRHVRDTSPPSVEYQLTQLGAQLIPALDAIVSVGHALKNRAAS
jgi:DNA-binding HxlR family transcriptional regulator